MRILHICQRDNPNEGGSLRVAEGLVKAQQSDGLDVWMLFLYGTAGELSEKFSATTVCLNLTSSRQAFAGVKKLNKAVREIKPDIIHSHDGIIWPRLAYLSSSIPVVTHAHLGAGNFKRLKDRLGWILIKKTTDALIGVSTQSIETWIETGLDADKTNYVPNGVDFDSFSPRAPVEKGALRKELGLPADKRIIVWIGRLHRETKGTDRVERIAPLMPPDAIVVVVGHGVEYEPMVSRCKPLIEEGRMVFTGSSSCPEKYYAAADLFLFSSYRETFGLVILEAIASGLPVMAFPVREGQGASALLEEFEAVVLSDDMTAQQVGSAFQQALDNTAKTQRLREHALSKYSWNTVSNQIVDVYRTLTNKAD